jgi:uncharacterized protein (TIGR00106 family)
MIIAFALTPLGIGEDVGEAVAEAVRVVRRSGLPNHTDAMFTSIEGEWDEVMGVVKQAVDAVAAVAPRVSMVLKADIRPGVTDGLTSKVEALESYLNDTAQELDINDLGYAAARGIPPHRHRCGILPGRQMLHSMRICLSSATSTAPTWSLPGKPDARPSARSASGHDPPPQLSTGNPSRADARRQASGGAGRPGPS